MSDREELQRRQMESIRYREAVKKERIDKHYGPDHSWAETMAVEMLLGIQAMKYEYHAAAGFVVKYFCTENGLNFTELERIASRMVSDDPNKPQP